MTIPRALALVAAMSAACALQAETPRVTVLRSGRNALVRCAFNDKEDLVVDVQDANEFAYLVAKGTPLAQYKKGRCIHRGTDDFSAMMIDGFGHLSGNHGSYFGHLLTLPGHGLAEADIGATVVHGSGERLCIVDVPDGDHLLLHPYGRPGREPKFKFFSDGAYAYGDRTLAPKETNRCQVWPMNRFRVFEWKTSDGKSVPDGVEVTSDHVDLEMEHDVVDPRSLVEYLHRNPGRRFLPRLTTTRSIAVMDMERPSAEMAGYMSLSSLLSVKTRFSYQPYCARTVDRVTRFNVPIASVNALDLIYMPNWGDEPFANTFFYIPRLKKMTLTGWNGNPDVEVDLSAGVVMPSPPWKVSYHVPKSDCLDPEYMPDRFIRIGGRPDRRVGVVLGYSPLHGVSAIENRCAERKLAYFFWHTGKMYPYIYNLTDVKAGRTIAHSGYTQYFDPMREPDATSFYHHRDGDAHLVYLDFHRSLSGKTIRLPPEFAGKKISVVERTPSVTLRSGDVVPADGLVLDVADGRGSLVLKLSD